MIDRTLLHPERRTTAKADLLDLIARGDVEAEKIEGTAAFILQEFDDYFGETRRIPEQAQDAFERRDHRRSLALSKTRLSLYTERVSALVQHLEDAYPFLTENERLWQDVERRYLRRIRGRYEADLAFAFFLSTRRMICRDAWAPVEYALGAAADSAIDAFGEVYRDFPGGARISPVTIAEILSLPYFSVPYRDIHDDARRVAARVDAVLGLDGEDPGAVRSIQMIDAGFFRNRGAYLVGRVVLRDSRRVPLIIALLNDAHGIYVDAVMNTEADAHYIFSSTLANFHATNPNYHELCEFLYSIMPNRPLGLHYSTIGFNHVGKVAVMNELRDERAFTNEAFETAVGFRGTVAIAFSAPSSNYTLKVIRNSPTAQYKWGRFEGIESVLDKYRRVHEINRTGSMLDNIIYYNVRFDRDWFEDALLEELLTEASHSVTLQDDAVVFRHLIAQLKMVPLPVFLETASSDDAETAVVNLGQCIKNNAAADIFNKDLDGRNYGVSKFLKVYLFDYDALEPFTDVKIRTNLDRVEGEEDIPDWFFEDGVVFLPEEIESGLRIHDRALRRRFRAVHGDLLTTAYWEAVQQQLRDGKVPHIDVYPDDRKIPRDAR